jgi:predicted AlkP superfamily phosphohydrolase/phosphomutase
MVALDAGEPSLVERWIDDGSLPNLAALRDEGCYGRLASSADWLAGSIWPSFHTGTLPGDHGLYHFVQWHKERMDLIRPSPDWLPMQPFWRTLGKEGRRVIAVDVPSAYGPEPIDGVEVYGWCNTDVLAPASSHPPEVFEWARRRFGPAQMADEVYSLERPRALLRLREDLIRWTSRTAELTLALMEGQDWDLCLVNLAAPHRAGHKLWSTTSVRGDMSDREQHELDGALREVYMACDEAVGRILEGAGPVAAIVFSLHGMGPNASRVPVLPEMLDRILTGRTEPPGPPPALHRLRSLVPNEWRARVKGLLPTRVQDRLTVYWRLGGLDASRTRAFPLVADLQGYVRINLTGRDADGIVQPGAEYEELCEEISAGLKAFVDADSGEPVVEEIIRSDRLYGDAQKVADLPDLIVRWSPTPASSHRAIVSPTHGSIDWPTPGRHPDGRSGNHRGEGFVLATGEGIGRRMPLDGAHIVDLAPTVCAMLGVPPRRGWTGKVLPLATDAEWTTGS